MSEQDCRYQGGYPEACPGRVMDLAIIGSGLAGLAASAFAVARGLSVVRVGSTGSLAYTTGYLDLLGASLENCRSYYAEPRAGLSSLREEFPQHPYAKLDDHEIEAAFREFLACLGEAGLPYVCEGNNLIALSPMGTLKSTYAVPATMLAGVHAFASRTPCLLVDFKGLKAFSAKGIAEMLHAAWPEITPVTLPFPDLQWSGELYPEAMARCLEVPATREALAESIKAALAESGAQCVGLPAVLGIYNSATVQEHLSALLGVPVFEIPTLPPGVPGIRLRETVDDVLRAKGVTLFAQRYAYAVRREDGLFHIDIGENTPEVTVHAKQLILATGRFLSGGLQADRVRGVSEPLLHLPVKAPENRAQWHKDDYFDHEGHPLNKAGIVTDDSFRPLDAAGSVIDPNLYVAGSILAEQDWVREKSGAGIAIASALKAVEAVKKSM
ncbi:glycerol-3-phosphate dehydrogenase subunit GlpB [Desulfovibrio sp. OttesenSCG-928-I05]|nr:glycerol-3-phosphate dehydrogenase subunit GlpB [Desulfovibrio sp. OttesenSCG-928-I05]